MLALGDSLKQWREYRHFTVAELARIAGVNVNAIYRLERGDHKQLYWENLYGLTKSLGVETFEALAEGPPHDGCH